MYPYVKLTEKESKTICDGQIVSAPKFCEKRAHSDRQCKQHYEDLKLLPNYRWKQCPYGYSSYRFKTEDHHLALTGIIPFPRVGNRIERDMAKISPSNRLSRISIENNVKVIEEILQISKDQVASEITRSLAALHEVRKYNRNLKQTLERYCNKVSPTDPDKAETHIVKAWKVSEFMSYQFDILSLIADENLTGLEPKTRSEIYRVFDKCVRIFKIIADKKNISLRLSGDSPQAIVSDKTFPIMATVLIDNAIKYSIPNSIVEVEIKIFDKGRFRVTVINEVETSSVTPENPFQRGVRGNDDEDGSGVGLYLAQLVARQHGTEILYNRTTTGRDTDKIEFEFHMSFIN